MQLKHLAMATLMAIIFGMGWVFAKAALSHFPPILLAAFRFGVTAICLVWFVRPPKGRTLELCLISLLAISVPYSMSYAGMVDLDVSTTVLLVQLEAPCLILMGALLLQERPSRRQLAGIICAICGVLLVIGQPRIDQSFMAVALVLGSIAIWALGQIRIRRLGSSQGITIIAWVSALATPQLLIGSALLEDGQIATVVNASWQAWAAVIYLGLVMTALGIGTWYHLIGKYPVAHVSPFLLLVPAISIAGGVVFLGEEVSALNLAGGAIIVLGVGLVVSEREKMLEEHAE
jgi:O-acetylserine/cysteine efflux transporter